MKRKKGDKKEKENKELGEIFSTRLISLHYTVHFFLNGSYAIVKLTGFIHMNRFFCIIKCEHNAHCICVASNTAMILTKHAQWTYECTIE